MKKVNYNLEDVVKMVRDLDEKLDCFVQCQEEINKRNDNKSFGDFFSERDVKKFRKIHKNILNFQEKIKKQMRAKI